MLFPTFIKFLLWMLFDFTIRKCCGSQLPEFRVSYINKCWQKDGFFTRRSGISLQQCVRECDNRLKCGSINYRRELKLCELIPTTAIVNDSATADGQCTIVNRHDIKSQNNCSCAEHKVCNPKTGNCTVEECAPFTITNGKFLGNMNIIGSRVKFTCNQDNTPTISICLANGTWSVNPPCNTDIDECDIDTDTCGDNGVCVNTQGSYTCICNSGYTGDGDSCTDIDECDIDTDTCDVNAECKNTQGSYTCTCQSGYTGDGQSCADIDECDIDTDTCDDNAVCENTQGSYTCTCQSGYTGDGQSCADIDECDIDTDTCDDNAVCGNTQGSYTCTCKCGYTGDGYTCTDINECVTGTDNCGENAECENTEGSYICFCNGILYTGQCPQNFVENKGSCYLFGPDRKNWNSARAYCQDNCGSHLVHIGDKAENDWIVSKMEDNDHWINLSDSLEEGKWVWNNTGCVAEYTNWVANHQNNVNDCVIMQMSSLWHVSRCGRIGPKPICELEIR